MSEVPTDSLSIPTADLTIPTAGGIEGDTFELERYGLSSEDYPELAGKSEIEVIQFIQQTLGASPPVSDPAPLPEPEPEKSSGFGAAFDYGSDNLQAMLGAGIKVLGQGTGIETLEEYGQDLQDKNEKEAEESLKKYDRVELEDVSFGDNLTTFVVQTLGETLPSLGMAIGAGVAGATAFALTPVAALTGTVGAGIGAFLPSALTITGEAQITAEQLSEDEDFESPGTMLLAGAAGGAIDTIALAIPAAKLLPLDIPTNALTKFFVSKGVAPEVAEGAVKKGRQALKDADNNPDLATQNLVLEGRDSLKKIADSKPIKGRNLLARTGIGGGKQSLIEGGTEAFQQAITTFAAETATGEEADDYAYNLLDAAVRGGIAGVGPGALAGGLTGRSKAAAAIAQEKQEKLQEALVIDEANSSPDFDEETSGVVSMEERTIGEDTFVEIIEQDAEDRVRTQRINLNDIVDLEPTEAEIVAQQQGLEEVEKEKENKGTPSEGDALAGMGVRDREGNQFAPEPLLENQDTEGVVASDLDREITDLKSEIAVLKRMRQLRARTTDPTETRQEEDIEKDTEITELIEQREAKLAQYKKFLDSNNNRIKYKDAYKSITGKNRKLENDLNKAPGLDFTDISSVDVTIEQLENADIGEAPSIEAVEAALELVGENLEPTDDRPSIIKKLKDGRELFKKSLQMRPSFEEALTINNADRLQEVFKGRLPKLMDTVDTTPPQNPRAKAPTSPEVKEGTESLAEVASEAESSRGKKVNLKNIIEKSRNDAEGLATKLTLWSRFMASSYQQATKYPALRPLVRVMEQYNVIWRSIISRW